MQKLISAKATPFYENLSPKYHLEYASTILACIATLLVVSVYVIYWKGPVLRKRSKFAQQLSGARDENTGRRASMIPGATGSRSNSLVYPGSMPGSKPATRHNSYI